MSVNKTLPSHKKVSALDIVYVGNTEIGLVVLKNILDAGSIPIRKVITMHSASIGFESVCSPRGIDLVRVEHISEQTPALQREHPDLIIEFGWSQLFNDDLLSICPVIGQHPTRLPERRGRAPVTWAIIDGLEQTAATMFYLDAGVDNGDIIYQEDIDIARDEDANTLLAKVNAALTRLVLRYFAHWPHNSRIAQDHSKATHKEKRTPKDSEISLSMSADDIDRHVRALQPPFYPPAFILNDRGEKIEVLKVRIPDGRTRSS